jgi:hypothetical protein
MIKALRRWGLMSALGVQGAAMAAAGTPLLEKVTSPGFVMAEYAITTSCVIHGNGRMTIGYRLGDLSSSRTVPLTLSSAEIKAAIAEAAKGKITTESYAVDVPTVTYNAYQRRGTGTPKQVLLFELNGGSGEKRVNESSGATRLRNFIDVNCGDSLQSP